MVNAIGNKLNFKNITELPIYKWFKLSKNCNLFCGSVGTMDSFLVIKCGDKSVVNLNDCVLNEKQLRYLKRKIGDVDILLTQFSFANWVGNESDQKEGANRKIKQLIMQNKILKPKQLIPFASFVYFCNEENKRMNNWVNLPETINRLRIENLKILYPGDEVNIGAMIPEKTHLKAVKNYSEDYGHLNIDPSPKAVPLNEIQFNTSSRLKVFLLNCKRGKKLAPLKILLKDYDQVLLINFRDSKVSIEPKTENIDLEICSQVANYFFKFPWGVSTVEISGMYLDHRFEKMGTHPFFILQNRIATEFIKFTDVNSFIRVLYFLWSKKWEILCRYI